MKDLNFIRLDSPEKARMHFAMACGALNDVFSQRGEDW
jgi:hypothetical protein